MGGIVRNSMFIIVTIVRRWASIWIFREIVFFCYARIVISGFIEYVIPQDSKICAGLLSQIESNEYYIFIIPNPVGWIPWDFYIHFEYNEKFNN